MTEDWLVVYFADDAVAHVEPDWLAALEAVPEHRESVRSVEIPVRYDGADLADVARACGLSTDDVRRLHGEAEYTVSFLGFMPGFAYLVGLPPVLEVPRLPTPRARVPKNAVAIAGRYAGVYPFESPGGWRLLGTAQVTLFDEKTGALLRPGDRVRFLEQP
jgi:KipI family sensor histidine kinase inhibitor